MPHTTAASLLALIGIFDVAGTIFSGWLTDRVDPRLLLGGYYTLRGLSLLILPSLFAPGTEPSMWVFIVFYGLDWIATVPPTVALCRNRFGDAGPVVFGWVFASHQVGAAIAAVGAGAIRDTQGSYDLAWYFAGGLCVIAALLSHRDSPDPGCPRGPKHAVNTIYLGCAAWIVSKSSSCAPSRNATSASCACGSPTCSAS